MILCTTKKGDVWITVPDALIAITATIALPPFLAWVALQFLSHRASPQLEAIFIVAIISPLVSIFVVPLGCLLGLALMNRGMAGWGMALIAGWVAGVLSTIVLSLINNGGGALFDPGSLGVLAAVGLIGSCYALVLWLTLYVRRPEAFRGAGQSGSDKAYERSDR